MAITYATLAREIDGKVEYIYPKTIASLVEYDTVDSVKTKIDKLEQAIVDVDDRITNVVQNIQDGTLANDELIQTIDTIKQDVEELQDNIPYLGEEISTV